MIKVAVDIGVIEFHAGENDAVGFVVQKLRSFVKESRVILIPLDNHPTTVSLAKSAAEVERNPTDKKTWIPPRLIQNPRHQRGRGGLPVRPCHYDRPVRIDEKSAQRLRERHIGDFFFEHGLCLRIISRNGVTDNSEIGTPRNIFLTVPGIDRNPQLSKKVTHRRINVLIRTGYLIPARME